jgi:hypothetical protein
MPESDEQRRWRILREKLDRLAVINPSGARVIEQIVDELLDDEGRGNHPPRPRKKGNGH